MQPSHSYDELAVQPLVRSAITASDIQQLTDAEFQNKVRNQRKPQQATQIVALQNETPGRESTVTT